MSEAAPLLEAIDLTAGYLPGVDILNGCSLRLDANEIVGVVGPNGAGKSTLVKTMFGLVPVRAGRVTLAGADITGLPAHQLVARGVGYVPQTHNVFGQLSVEDNLRMGIFLRSKDARRRVAAIVELFPLVGERRHQRAGSLSGGERQIVAMARALMMEPKVLLLDEPSAGLSPRYQDEAFRHVHRDPRERRLDRDRGAERAPLPGDLQPRLRPRPGPQRPHRHRPRAARRPEGGRALPGHARRGPLADPGRQRLRQVVAELEPQRLLDHPPRVARRVPG